MAFRGGNWNRPGADVRTEVTKLIDRALKDAQHPSGLRVPSSFSNGSMYGAVEAQWVDNHDSQVYKLPPFRFSLSNPRHYGLNVTVREVDLPIFSTAGSIWAYANSYRPEFYRQVIAAIGQDNYNRMTQGLRHYVSAYTPEWHALSKNIEIIANSFNVDTSDMQSDYFNERFSVHVKVSPDLEAKSHATAARIVDALEIAFPDTWAGLVAQAADEEHNAFEHPGNPEWAGTHHRTSLDVAIRRALEALRSGSLAIPFNPSRRGWSLHRGGRYASGRVGADYYVREKKLKPSGELRGYVASEPGKPFSKDPHHPVGPSDHEWMVRKYSGGLGPGRRYRNEETLQTGVASSVEDGVNMAERAMGIDVDARRGAGDL